MAGAHLRIPSNRTMHVRTIRGTRFLTGGYSHVDKVLDVVGLALAQLLSVDPLRHKHAPGRELRVVARNHNLFARRIASVVSYMNGTSQPFQSIAGAITLMSISADQPATHLSINSSNRLMVQPIGPSIDQVPANQ